jgi:hypothetical protein
VPSFPDPHSLEAAGVGIGPTDVRDLPRHIPRHGVRRTIVVPGELPEPNPGGRVDLDGSLGHASGLVGVELANPFR